jgi:hypothetical protein
VSAWGLPNGYVLGAEGGGAFFGGLRYGEGMPYTKNAGASQRQNGPAAADPGPRAAALRACAIKQCCSFFLVSAEAAE